jgi:thiol-disulfide isomerase/thioredoxin
MRKLIILLFCIVIYSCNDKKQEIVARIDGRLITMQQVDELINEQLFHMLEGIYLIRKQALDEYINQIVITEEAKRQNLSEEKLLDKEIMPLLVDSLIEERIVVLHGFVPDRTDPKKIYDCKTAFGREYLRESMLLEAKSKYAYKLRAKHKIEIFIKTPYKYRPKVNLKGIALHFKGNLKSNVELIFIGNYECEGCIQAKPIVDYINSKYGEKIKFGFCYYDVQPSLAAKAVEAANLQNKYWEMHEMFFTEYQHLDTTDILIKASLLGLNKTKLKKDLSSQAIQQKLEQNIKIINENKIVTTPTIVINGNVFNAPFNQSDIEDYILTLLND